MITLKPLLKILDDEADIQVINYANSFYIFAGKIKHYKGRSYPVIKINIIDRPFESYRLYVHFRIKSESK